MPGSKQIRPNANDEKPGERESREVSGHITHKQRGPNEQQETTQHLQDGRSVIGRAHSLPAASEQNIDDRRCESGISHEHAEASR
jgi:hypothetical protein